MIADEAPQPEDETSLVGAWLRGRPIAVGAVAVGLLVVGAIAWAAIAHHPHPKGDIGFGEMIVGGGTLLLAAATFVMALKTAALADETREGIKTSATQFRQERMPVVMPVGELPAGDPVRVVDHTVVMPRGQAISEPPGTLPYAVERGDQKGQVVNVPIENVGSGPALGISATLFFLDHNGARSVGPQPAKIRDVTLPALGPGQRARLRFGYRGLALPLLSYRLVIEYQDGAGGPYKITSTFVENDLAYGPVGFTPPPELRLPGFEDAPVPLTEGLPRTLITDEPIPGEYDALVGTDEGVHD